MKPYVMRIYQDKAGEWRWRLKAPNGRTVADSGEGYQRQAGAVRAARKLLAMMSVAVGWSCP